MLSRFGRSALFALALCFAAGHALARPGGGHTFGGGSHSVHVGSGSRSHGHGGGGGGGGGELIFFFIRLLFFYPWLSIPMLVVVYLVWRHMQRMGFESWDSSSLSAAARPAARSRIDLARLRELDPEFSRIVFEDFAYRLYASAQRARHDARALAALAPYLSEPVRAELAAEPPIGVAVTNVVVGALRIESLSVSARTEDDPGWAALSLDYQTNLTLPAAHKTFYQRERWVLRRAADARTKPPEDLERLGCPNCGAPFESSDGRRCQYCGQVVADGRFAWQVSRRVRLERQERPPALTSDVAEQGTNLPSVIAPDLEAAWSELCARDPALGEQALYARIAQIYETLNRAWTALELSSVRGLVSDALFDYLRYWTESYSAQGLSNRLERMSIERTERVKVVLDRHFDAITVRVWASGLDYTVSTRTGARVSGSQTQPRAYSEYWTLIRSAGVSGAPRSAASCPSCGSPLQVSMAGNCEHCGSHLTRGEFDWVLSKIEQDDVYAG